MKRPASLATSIVLIFLATAQLCRVVFRITIIAEGFEIPIWPSVIAVIFLGALAFWLLRERSSG